MAAVAAFIVIRSCGYDLRQPLVYVAYLLAHVVLPGLVAVRFLDARPLDAGRILALALPAGLALESLQFLSLAAIGAKAWHAWSPLGWLALLLWQASGGRVLKLRVSAHHAGVAGFLTALVTVALALAAGQMFTESPLANGVPAHGIFHDWVYLISRAAVIKNHWPLEDPSLAGTPLQYHYFMMVHAAAASWTTGLEISTVMLRLLYLPLSLALVAQVFLLGRAVSRSVWGGCGAGFLFLATSELSFSTNYGETLYLGLFSRWLFVSPTFFHGMIYAGAVLVVLRDVLRRRELGWRYVSLLLLLGVGGTGAKGTVLPVMVAALVLLGARLAEHHRVHRLEMRRVGRQREVDDVAVELAVGRRSEMVLHVARAAHFLGLRGAALELGEQRGVALVQHMHERVEAAAVRHADADLAHPGVGGALKDRVHQRDH